MNAATLGQVAEFRAGEIVEKKDSYPEISRSDTVSKLISLFEETGRYEALVTGDDRYSAVTVRDSLKVVHPERTSVASISGSAHLKLTADTRIYDTATMLVNNRRRLLPVLDEDQRPQELMGVVRQRRILDEMRSCEDLKEFSAEDLMAGEPTTVDRNASVGAARSMMLRGGFSHLPVTAGDDGRLFGLVTARDLVMNYLKPRESTKVGERAGERTVWTKMTISGLADRHPLEATRKTSAAEVARDLIEGDRSCCLIVERSHAIGIITPRDFVSLLKQYKPKLQIPLYIVGADDVEGHLVESARRKIERVALRGLKLHPDIREIIVHARTRSPPFSHGGRKGRIAMRARVYTDSGVFGVEAGGWTSFLSVTDDLCEKLDSRLRSAKGYRTKRKAPGRGRRSVEAIHY